MPTIHTVFDSERGCGWRKGGGLYLVGGEFWDACGKLPLRLEVCPCCGSGVRLTRGLSRINPSRLFADAECSTPKKCRRCNLATEALPDLAYLMGVGAKFYPSRADFMREAIEQGISKRIAQIPRDFKIGETQVFLAHPKVFMDLVDEEAEDTPLEVDEDDEQQPLVLDGESKTTGRQKAVYRPGVFCVFTPQRIEYVVKGDETDDFLKRLEGRGVTLVKVIRRETKQLPLSEA